MQNLSNISHHLLEIAKHARVKALIVSDLKLILELARHNPRIKLVFVAKDDRHFKGLKKPIKGIVTDKDLAAALKHQRIVERGSWYMHAESNKHVCINLMS
ncbi:MAG: hypothetical protein ACM3KM_03990 [Acidobacteriaceae bacterium]